MSAGTIAMIVLLSLVALIAAFLLGVVVGVEMLSREMRDQIDAERAADEAQVYPLPGGWKPSGGAP